MVFIPGGIGSHDDIFTYKIAKYMNHQRSVYRTRSSVRTWIYSQIMDLLECITLDNIVRN